MTLKEIRARKRIGQHEAVQMCRDAGMRMNIMKWSVMEAIDTDLVKELERVFGEKVDIPAGDYYDK